MSSSRLVVVIIVVSGVGACVRDARVTPEWRASGARDTTRHDDAMRCDAICPHARARTSPSRLRALCASSPSAPPRPPRLRALAPFAPPWSRGPEKERRGLLKTKTKQKTKFACVALRQDQAKTYLQNGVSAHFRFWLRRHAAFHHTSHPTPNTETSAFRDLRCFPNLARTCGVLGGDNSKKNKMTQNFFVCMAKTKTTHQSRHPAQQRSFLYSAGIS